MVDTYIETLDSIFADVAEPAWSSYVIETMLGQMSGETKAKLQRILPYVDDKFAASPGPLTRVQANFLRDITVVVYYADGGGAFAPGELDWLLDRFRDEPLPQRALMIIFLLSLEDCAKDLAAQIDGALVGTPGEQWLGNESAT